MSRVNFFQLLELKINPPESDPQVIDAAIKRKQAEWSRLRNHPTKGTQARQYMSLLNEIRKVMGDNRMREEEARNALDLLKKRLEAKFKIIDSQVHLLGAKGDLSQDEIARLAAFHKVKPHIIERRVDRWRKKFGHPLKVYLNRLLAKEKPDEKAIARIAGQFNTTPEEVQGILNHLLDERSAEVNAYINIQIRKGFVTEKEISDLAEIYALDQGDILRRIRCPIKKESESESDHAHQLDSTVEQFINDNLKVVEHDSLYSFLGLFPGSSLEALQTKAVEREKEIRKISQKDAYVTASGVLVGQCISIFKSDESRYAYDLARAKSLLRNLNQDIGLAVDRDSIRLEYYSHLLRKAISFGTPPENARQHILDYCRSKNWKVDLPRKQLNLKRYMRVAVATLAIVLIAGSTFWYFYFSNQRLQEAYARTLKEAEAQPNLEAQIRILEKFLAAQKDADIRGRAADMIESLNRRIVQRDFKLVSDAADNLVKEQRFEDIQALYNDFLARHADSEWAEKIRPKLEELPALIDVRDYQRIAAISIDAPETLAHAGVAYLRQHPEGAHVKQTTALIQRAEGPYYQNVLTSLNKCEETADWNQCIRIASRYIDVYGDSTFALKLKERRDQYAIHLQNRAVLGDLLNDAGGTEAGLAAKRAVFEAFLRDSPRSAAVPLVRSELDKINQQIGLQEAQQEQAKLNQRYGNPNGRFAIQNQDTVRDSKSGLTWALLDSRFIAGQCMTYDETLRYVNTMKLGGYSDWRLPRAKEIIGLYSGAAPFEGTPGEWYWSADSFKRYAGEWIILVDVVQPLPQPSSRKENSKKCGWFRPVRP